MPISMDLLLGLRRGALSSEESWLVGGGAAEIIRLDVRSANWGEGGSEREDARG